MRIPPSWRSASRRTAPALLLAVLLAGMVAHVGHHLLDPDCDAGRGAAAHPCVACAALHGGVEPETAGAILPMLPRGDAPVAAAVCARLSSDVWLPTNPRAPPLA